MKLTHKIVQTLEIQEKAKQWVWMYSVKNAYLSRVAFWYVFI